MTDLYCMFLVDMLMMILTNILSNSSPIACLFACSFAALICCFGRFLLMQLWDLIVTLLCGMELVPMSPLLITILNVEMTGLLLLL